MEVFESSIGQICLNANEYCKGCPDFEPRAFRLCKIDNEGHLLFTEEHEPIYNGIGIRCDRMFMCQNIRGNLLERMKGE